MIALLWSDKEIGLGISKSAELSYNIPHIRFVSTSLVSGAVLLYWFALGTSHFLVRTCFELKLIFTVVFRIESRRVKYLPLLKYSEKLC